MINKPLYTLGAVCFLMQFSAIASAEESVVPELPENYEDLEQVEAIGQKTLLNTEASALTDKLLVTAGTAGDPIQAVFTLPGVVQVDEEDPNPAVRGSSPNANLFLVDDLPISFLFHEFGNSIFNENLIHDFGFKPAGFGARYGKATGAVFDVSLRDPKQQSIETTLDLSLLRAGAMLEGAVADNQAFYVSYRASLIQHFIDEDELDEEDDILITELPESTDYQAKYQWLLGNDNILTLQASGARDKATAEFGERSEEVLLDPGLEGSVNVDQSYNSQSMVWRNAQSKLVLGHIVDKQEQRVGNGDFFEFTKDSLILKAEHGWQWGDHLVSTGANFEQLKYDYQLKLRLERCSDFSPGGEFDRRDVLEDKRKQDVNIYAGFIEDQWSLSSGLTLTSGLHLTKDDYLNESYLDPRLALTWQASPQTTFSSSIGRYHQLPEEEQIFPLIGNPNLTSLSSTHYVMGMKHIMDNAWFNDSWSWNVDLYYKDIDDLVVDTDDDTQPFLNRGHGEAYGLELMLNKELTDRWYGWLSVSLSETERTNELTDQTIPFSYDTPVVANLVLNYQMTKNWNAGLRWTYRTGTLYTPVIGNQENPQFAGSYIPVYGDINSQRLDDYHRLDIRFERPFQGKLKGSFYVDLLNVYGRNNVSSIDYEPVPNSREFKLTKSEGIGFFPSVGVKLIF